MIMSSETTKDLEKKITQCYTKRLSYIIPTFNQYNIQFFYVFLNL